MATALVCGDSTLDNAPYVGAGGRPLYDHLEEALGGAVRIDFRALDGAVIADVVDRQFPAAEEGAAYDALVLSVGGNDALGHLPLLDAPDRRTLVETALFLRTLQVPFRADYRRMLARARDLAPRILCVVVYRAAFTLDPALPAAYQDATATLLSIFTDVIAEEARAAGADVLDLRPLFVDEALYANPIEPNDPGGRVIADHLARWLAGRP